MALITGANKGIGLETARQLGHMGITVVLGARDLRKGEEAAGKLRDEGIDARALKLDVTSQEDRSAAEKFLRENFGKLDILVNNAGVMLGAGFSGNDASRASAQSLRDTFETNFFAPVALTQELIPLLRNLYGNAELSMS